MGVSWYVAGGLSRNTSGYLVARWRLGLLYVESKTL